MTKENEILDEKKLSGFPRGWVIFMIIYVSASLMSILNDPEKIFVFGLFLCGMIIGLSLMLKKRHYGFWILLGSSIMLTMINGTVFGGSSIVSSGGLILVFLTWLFTRKQIDYRLWKP